MGRKSKIDRLGLGPKILAYAQLMPHNEILRKVEREHPGASLTYSQLSRYIQANTANSVSEPPSARDVQAITAEAFRDALTDAINEAKSKYEELKDDPKAGWAWFKHYLETLDRMGKVVGAYRADSRVSVQVGPIYNQETFEKGLKDAEEYFQSLELERVGGEHHA